MWPTAKAVGKMSIAIAFRAPAGATESSRSNYKTRIKFHSMLLEQRHDLFLIRQFAVMLFLTAKCTP